MILSLVVEQAQDCGIQWKERKKNKGQGHQKSKNRLQRKKDTLKRQLKLELVCPHDLCA